MQASKQRDRNRLKPKQTHSKAVKLTEKLPKTVDKLTNKQRDKHTNEQTNTRYPFILKIQT